MADRYVLKGKEPVEEPDPTKWATFFSSGNRTVRKSYATLKLDGQPIEKILVSTVFLGLNHNYTNEGPPMLFETLVFGGPMDQEMNRCATWDEAELMHDLICGRIEDIVEEHNGVIWW